MRAKIKPFYNKDHRFSSNVFAFTQNFKKKSNAKLVRGFHSAHSKVTFMLDGQKGKADTRKGNTFELRVQGALRNFNGLSDGGASFGDFIMKQAEFHNIMNQLLTFDTAREKQQIIDDNEQLIRESEAAEKNNDRGFDKATSDKQVKSYKAKIVQANKDLKECVNKLTNTYKLFMGETAGQSYDNIVYSTLQKSVKHKKVFYQFKKLAYFWDKATDTIEGRAEEFDDKADDPNFKNEAVTFRWKKVAYSHEVDQAKGLSMDGILDCIRLHACEVGGYGRAEHQRKHMQNNLLFPNCLELSVADMANTLLEMNKNMPLLPSFKDNPDYADVSAVPEASFPLSPIELCSILLDAMPKEVQLKFHENSPNNPLRFDIMQLAVELQPIVDSVREQRRQARANNGGGGGASSSNGNNNRNKSNKNNNNNNNNNKDSNAKSGGKNCELCKKYGGNPATHNTAQCRKYHSDGTPKAQPGSHQKKGVFFQSQEEFEDKCYDMFEKFSERRPRSSRSGRSRRSRSRSRSDSRDRSSSRSPSRRRSRRY